MRHPPWLANALVADARRAVAWAGAVAIALGGVEVWSAAVALKQRNHPDLEIASMALDGIAVFALGIAGVRGGKTPFVVLMVLALAGVAYQRFEGLPWAAAITNLVTAGVYWRAWRALGSVRALTGATSTASG